MDKDEYDEKRFSLFDQLATANERIENCLLKKEVNESHIMAEAEVDMAQATQFLYDMATNGSQETKIIASEIVSDQKQLQNKIVEISADLDKLISTSSELTNELQLTDMETNILNNFESWIDITSQQLGHMKSQIYFINGILEDRSIPLKSNENQKINIVRSSV
jgi:hypothetical protein